MAEESAVHPPISGGCLCGEIRYTISFPAGSQFPPDPHTCQCTQCRKGTGAVIAYLIGLSPKQIHWEPPKPKHESVPATSTFREYCSSPGCFRGFCENCGTTLTWRSEETPHELELMTGSIDEKHLLEEKGLSIPSGGQFWCRNYIKGVTDRISAGTKWVEGTRQGLKIESLTSEPQVV